MYWTDIFNYGITIICVVLCIFEFKEVLVKSLDQTTYQGGGGGLYKRSQLCNEFV